MRLIIIVDWCLSGCNLLLLHLDVIVLVNFAYIGGSSLFISRVGLPLRYHYHVTLLLPAYLMSNRCQAKRHLRVVARLKILLLLVFLLLSIVEGEVFDVATSELGCINPVRSCATLFLDGGRHLNLLGQSTLLFAHISRQDCFLLMSILQDTLVVINLRALPYSLLLVILIVLLKKRSDRLELTLRLDGRQLRRSVWIEE